MDTIRTGTTSYDKPYALVLVEGEASALNARMTQSDRNATVTQLSIIGTDDTLWVTHGKEDGSMMDAITILQEASADDLVVACFPKQCAMYASRLDFALPNHDSEVGFELLGTDDGEDFIAIAIVTQYVSFTSEREETREAAYAFLEEYLEREVERVEIDTSDVPF